jgi:hypothetical protein
VSCWITLGLCAGAVLIRLAHKFIPALSALSDPCSSGSKRAPGLDGLFITLTLFTAAACFALTTLGVDRRVGSPAGLDTWALSDAQLAAFGPVSLATQVTHIASMALIKTSFLLLFLRLFDHAA